MRLIQDKAIAEKVAEALLSIQAIQLNPEQPFTWSSGWKSPIYCDNRIALSYPATRSFIKEALMKAIQQHFPEVELIAGVATAGIAQGALVADGLQLPFAYVRPKAKDHGMGNQIEGRVKAGQKVVVLEDLISTGGSSLKAVEALREAGAEVVGMAAIFTYGFDVAQKAFEEQAVPLIVLSDYGHLIQMAIEKDIVTKEQETFLSTWREDPSSWNR